MTTISPYPNMRPTRLWVTVMLSILGSRTSTERVVNTPSLIMTRLFVTANSELRRLTYGTARAMSPEARGRAASHCIVDCRASGGACDPEWNE